MAGRKNKKQKFYLTLLISTKMNIFEIFCKDKAVVCRGELDISNFNEKTKKIVNAMISTMLWDSKRYIKENKVKKEYLK